MNRKQRRLPDWIEDIRCAIGNIKEDTKGLTKARFLDDGKSQRGNRGLTPVLRRHAYN